jgi:hypothetical protein
MRGLLSGSGRASGVVVYSAPVVADLGKWSTSYPHVYAIDFSLTWPAAADGCCPDGR